MNIRTSRSNDLQWAIIGGGVHGTCISAAALARGVPARALRVFDPFRSAMSAFARHITVTGMDYMRSPPSHHLHPDQGSLQAFAESHVLSRAKDRNGRVLAPFSHRGNPSCRLWLQHARWTVRSFKADAVRDQATVHEVRAEGGSFALRTSHSEVRAANLVLALGLGYGPNWPWWTRALQRDAPAMVLFHAFEESAARAIRAPCASPLVIGGGITAAQLALLLAGKWEGGPPVTMITHHPLRVSEYDCDTEWMEPTRLAELRSVANYDERRHIVDNAKVRGTLTPEVYEQLEAEIARGAIAVKVALVVAAHAASENSASLELSDGTSLTTDYIALATGFAHRQREHELLERVSAALGLPRNGHGDPIIGPDLTWERPGIFVTGALAELQLGPFASNIIGARWAAARLGCLPEVS